MNELGKRRLHLPGVFLLLGLLFSACSSPSHVEVLLDQNSEMLKNRLIGADSVAVYRTKFSEASESKFGERLDHKALFLQQKDLLYRPLRIFVSGDSLICWVGLQMKEADSLPEGIRYISDLEGREAPFVVIHPQECRISELFLPPLSGEALALEKRMIYLVEFPDSLNFELSMRMPFLDPDLQELEDHYRRYFPEWRGGDSLEMLEWKGGA